MTKIDNLNSGQLGPLIRRIENLERSLNLASSSVERGRMRFYEGSELLIQDSNLNVVGTATIRGTLKADGTIAFTGTLTQSGPSTFTGPTNVSGDFTVTGPTKLNGQTDIGGNTSVDGTLDIKGRSTLQNDLEVTGGGKIKAGGMTLDPAASGGSVVFAGGGGVQGTAGVVALRGSGNAGFLTSEQASIFAGSTQIDVANGAVTITGLPTTSTGKANVHMDASGRLYLVTNP